MIRNLVRQHSVERTVLEFFAATDRRDWRRARRVLADRITVALTGLAEISPGELPADEFVDEWRRQLVHCTGVHHQIGNVRSSVHDDDGHVACYATIHHLLPEEAGGELHLHVGSFDIGLRDSPRGWHLDTLRFRRKFARRIPPTPYHESDLP